LAAVMPWMILALTGDIRRFSNQEHYASYAGTAPIDVSSGEVETHICCPRLVVWLSCALRSPGWAAAPSELSPESRTGSRACGHLNDSALGALATQCTSLPRSRWVLRREGCWRARDRRQ
jgi:hypothetical protein